MTSKPRGPMADLRALRRVLFAFFAIALNTADAEWTPAGELDQEDISTGLAYAKRTAIRPTDGAQVTAHLALFTSRDFRLEVVDLGDAPAPRYPGMADACRVQGCVAAVNGGFFHPDWRPAGLMIARGARLNRLETAKLLSGVIYGDTSGIHLVRRARFQDQAGITALLQTGPYLVEAGLSVTGLSAADPQRRTFIATDWRGNWALGATPSSVSLADLADCLASPGALLNWKVDRAVNLDGGSSSGFYLDRGAEKPPASLRPWKRVRNLLAIAPR